jgi:hypothetical protein
MMNLRMKMGGGLLVLFSARLCSEDGEDEGEACMTKTI